MKNKYSIFIESHEIESLGNLVNYAITIDISDSEKALSKRNGPLC